jgi:hypothetical protein
MPLGAINRMGKYMADFWCYCLRDDGRIALGEHIEADDLSAAIRDAYKYCHSHLTHAFSIGTARVQLGLRSAPTLSREATLRRPSDLPRPQASGRGSRVAGVAQDTENWHAHSWRRMAKRCFRPSRGLRYSLSDPRQNLHVAIKQNCDNAIQGVRREPGGRPRPEPFIEPTSA